ncbi:Rz-like spanin [Serratia phage CHI14]|uniref:Putative membrane protein n=2 Tax=Winklervirus chi14 TaxID=2560752 RepID=A0A1Z1LYK6_9CAUD|nr:Rz-like spanin [Serratia phage CHI14]ARW57649.1 putative membrane protein [Serratia phage CHI14]ARW57924.1 putative membrane protein [Serratia phage CBH8]
MFKVTLTHVLIAAVFFSGLGFIKYQESRIDTLNSDLKIIQKVAKDQSDQLDGLVKSFDSLKKIDESRSANRGQRDKSDQKMAKDAKRSDLVVAKPKLVEKQINMSFDKLTQDMQEATR